MPGVLQQEHVQTSGSGDCRHELQALAHGCGIFRSTSRLVALTGGDRRRWLNGMVSNNIRDLAAGQGVYAFVLNPQGHIQGDLYVFDEGERLIAEIEFEQLETLLAIFRRYIIMDKVEIEEFGEKLSILGLVGPKSEAVLSALGLSTDIGALQSADATWNGTKVRLVRLDHPMLSNYQLWISSEKADALAQASLSAGAAAVGADALETLRIVCGIPKVGKDIRQRDLPQETGQERALHFTKGCYIGQEIVERIRSRGAVHRILSAFEVEGPVPSSGTKILSDGKDVGEITSVTQVPLPGRQAVVALGYLRKEVMAPGKEFEAGGARLRTAPLPFREALNST